VTGVVKATYGTAVFLSLLNAALVATDDLSRYVIAQAGGNIGKAAGSLMSAAALTSLVASDPMAVVILGLLMILGGLVLYATLLVRSVAVYAVAMAGPVVLAGQVYDTTRQWFRRWVEVLFALVVSKLAIVLLFVLGMAMLHGQAGITGVLGGALVVGLASFSPLFVYKLFHFVGLEAGHLVHEGFHRPGTSPVGQALQAASRVDRVRSLLAPMGAAGLAGAGASWAATTAADSADRDAGDRKATAGPGPDGGPVVKRSSRPGTPREADQARPTGQTATRHRSETGGGADSEKTRSGDGPRSSALRRPTPAPPPMRSPGGPPATEGTGPSSPPPRPASSPPTPPPGRVGGVPARPSVPPTINPDTRKEKP
jgi:hypothetical protein